MLISCSICKELICPTSEVVGIVCGHLYHKSCLEKWMELRKSCPRCRRNVKQKPHKIYFDFEDSDGFGTDTELSKDALKEKATALNMELAESKKKIEELVTSEANLRKEIVTLGETAATYKTVIKNMKIRIKDLSEINENYNSLCEVNKSLTQELETRNNIAVLLRGASEEVQEMVNNIPVTTLAVQQLCMYVCVLKQELKKNENLYKKEIDIVRSENFALERKLKILSNRQSRSTLTSINKTVEKNDETTDLETKKLLKRSNSVSVSEIENKQECSASTSACEQPMTKKPCKLVCKKIINNLDKTQRKDISSDPSDIGRIIKLDESKSGIFKPSRSQIAMKMAQKNRCLSLHPGDTNEGTHEGYAIWGRPTRHLLPPPEKRKFNTFTKTT